MADGPVLVWFRRDLRVHDHPALHGAGERALGVFVLDPALSGPPNRVAFMLACVAELRESLRARGGELLVRTGDPVRVLPALAAEAGAEEVRWTSDVSPFARRRDRALTAALGGRAAPQSGTYVADPSRVGAEVVFAAWERRWEQAPRRAVLPPPERLRPTTLEPGALPVVADPLPLPIAAPGERAGRAALDAACADVAGGYAARRSMVAGGTSVLSPHLRWGTVSAREAEERLRTLGGRGPGALRRQLAWRDFCAHLLLRHPRVLQDGLRPRAVETDDAPERLATWAAGRTGFPLVDAGMRQLAAQGWMHNRARMLTASFLVHDLHLDRHLGERHFASLLYDYEPAQNALNWQWVAGVGADPGDFVRVFNPLTQAQEHDPRGDYIRRWVPELADLPAPAIHEPAPLERAAVGYPEPMVDHARERKVAVARFAEAQRGA